MSAPKLKKVVLAYSGGLDTSVLIKMIKEKYGADVITLTVEVGLEESNLGEIEEKAKKIGAIATYSLDVRDEFIKDHVFPAIKANALYQDEYPLSTALSRYLISKKLVEIAKKEGADAIAHGATAKGNDQVRFDITVKALAPDIEIIAPIREFKLSRDEAIDYAKKNNIPVSVTKKHPYSTDESIWGRSCECGVLEDLGAEPPEDAYEWTQSPKNAPNEPEYVEIYFEKGIPTKVDGKTLKPIELIKYLNKKGGTHSIGRIDHVEDRVVGLKSREIYECPAATILIVAHKDLEKLVLTRHESYFKSTVDMKWSELIYTGLWVDPLREDLDAFVDKVNERVTGTIKVKLYKGNVQVVSRSSKFALYDRNLATYEKESDIFEHDSAEGFIDLWGLQSRIAYNMKRKK